jgi:3'-phosphoadenosine 5'-phosphosulfate sulfotransferase (PAPS reductase)/FAD synthetase
MKFFALYSGGKDSTATVQYLAERDQLAGVVAIDTGIATPDWFPFIEKTANERNWNLEVYKTPADYDSLVSKFGFPGPAMHGIFMNYLKGRCIRAFKKKFRDAVLASGVRSQESARRAIGTKEWSLFEGVKVWAPIFDWSTSAVWQYVRAHGYERSPAYQTLCISGDCLCGAFATKLERAAIRAFYPSVSDRLEFLEHKTGKDWGWGANRSRKRTVSPVCVDCDAKEVV